MPEDANSQLVQLKEQVALLERRIQDIEFILFQQRRRSLREKFRPKLWNYWQYLPRPLRVPAFYSAQRPPPNAPRIAIVTPSFNQADYVSATIDSVLGQDYPNLAYVVQDGGSTDGTQEILRSYGDKLHWSSKTDGGQAEGINRGFDLVQGDIMAYLNSDDVLLPGTLAYVAEAFTKYPNVDVVYGNRIIIDKDGMETARVVLPSHDATVLKWADYIPQETMFWRRRVWEGVGPFDINFRFALDWDFILRAQAAGFKFRRLPRFHACFRVHEVQKTTAMVDVGREEQDRLRLMHLGHQPSGRRIDRHIRGYLRRHLLYHRLYKAGLLRM